ncbi:hypothetical protein UlMin_007554 [Ulmus minor]
MASFKIAFVPHFLLLAFLLILSPFFHNHSNLVAANTSLIQFICQMTEAPQTCAQCLAFDRGAEKAGKAGLVAILINCTSIHADELASNMSEIASGCDDQTEKSAFVECGKDYIVAKEELLVAIVMFKIGDFEKAQKCLSNALYEYDQCQFRIQSYRDKISAGVDYKARIYEQLCLAASKILELFK